MSAYIQGTIRGPVETNVMTVNADGSINVNVSGTKNVAAGSAATLLSVYPGIVRDPVSGTAMLVNVDGSINVAAE